MPLRDLSLDDKYLAADGQAYMSGVQALVRLALEQRRRDRAAGLDTAGFISGYRGSPLATYDKELWRAHTHLEAAGVRFHPGLNEDLAATSVWGSQQAELNGEGRHDGIFGIWYGKGPGVDRSGDALRHGNLSGSSRHGGVLLLLGDDHTAESSSAAHQSEYAMVDYSIPVLNPAGVQEILDFGLWGLAMSRYSGAWVALKCVHDVVESSAVIEVGAARAPVRLPEDHAPPPDGLNIRLPDAPLAQETRLHRGKLPAVLAFARANPLNRRMMGGPGAKIGLISAGKAYLDLMQALELLGIDAARAERTGVSVYKVGLAWPLEPRGIAAFCTGLETAICVEEKRGLIEGQVREVLYGRPGAPAIIGKADATGAPLFCADGVLNPVDIALALAPRLAALDPAIAARADGLAAARAARPAPRAAIARLPHFCAGCPHNTSTRVPEASRAMAGTGCSYMVQWMDRRTLGYTHMGADGVTWIGEAPFSTRDHIFQNMGDGTYHHSGILAIRAAVAGGVNITYKILYNDAVAMTGGQGHDGPLTVPRVAAQVLAEGVAEAVVVTDEPGKYRAGDLPAGVRCQNRDDLEAVQRRLREVPGVTVLIYDQTCAAEKRRRRKRGKYPDPPQRIFINDLVCEGCGDCGEQSNCIAILPLETEFGRKRRIDQHACNKDYSCRKGFCPSFVTVEGGALRQPERSDTDVLGDDLPEPDLPPLDRPRNLVISGVGGTGVLTISALLGTAAHLEGKGCTVLDMTGLAQKGGAVVSYVRIGADPAAMSATRIGEGQCDVLLGADMVVSLGPLVYPTLAEGRSFAVLNSHQTMPGTFTREPDFRLPEADMAASMAAAVGTDNIRSVDAHGLAERLLGDPILANLMMLGMAWQLGQVPVGRAAIVKAVALNGVAVEANSRAFEIGRGIAARPQLAEDLRGRRSAAGDPLLTPATTLEEIVARRVDFLTRYQSARYAARYGALVERVRAAEAPLGGNALAVAVARNAFKLMACKDEYEVARLYTDGRFARQLAAQFEGDIRLRIHLAPPILGGTDAATGRPRKRTFGPWVLRFMGVLARLKGLRGTPFDPFGHTAERRTERRLVRDYEALVETQIARLSPATHAQAVELAGLPEMIRGFGPVKAESIARYAVEKARLVAGLDSPGTQSLSPP